MSKFVEVWFRNCDRDESEMKLYKKILFSVITVVFTFTGYFIVGFLTSEARARSLQTSLDDSIPFLPWSIYFYVWAYTIMFYPVFIIRCPCLLRRYFLSTAVVSVVCFSCWVAFPVGSTAFRVDLDQISRSTFHGWGMWLLYTTDPQYNLFPSLHIAGAVIVGLVAKQVRATYCWIIMPAIVVISISILTTKQHYIIDGLAGGLVGLVVWWIIVRPIRTTNYSAKRLASSWKGPVAYLVFHTLVYTTIYVAFHVGWAPWEKHSSLSDRDQIREVITERLTGVGGRFGADKQKGEIIPILWLSATGESAGAVRRRPLLCFSAGGETISVLQNVHRHLSPAIFLIFLTLLEAKVYKYNQQMMTFFCSLLAERIDLQKLLMGLTTFRLFFKI